MTFDDGIVKIYKIVDVAENGNMPETVLQYKSLHDIEFEAVSYNRFFAGLQAKEQIDCVIKIWQDRSIETSDVCITEDGKQYRVVQAQHAKNDDGMEFTRISMAHLEENMILESLMKVKKALNEVSNNVSHYVAQNKNDCYIVWAEDGSSNTSFLDNEIEEQVITGTIDFFTKKEMDILVDDIQNALNKNGIAFVLNSVQYEDETKYIHHEWRFEVS